MIPEHTEIVTELLQCTRRNGPFQSSSRNHQKRLYFRKNQKRRLCKSTLIFKFIIQGSREDLIIDKMLFAAMIEARSCERFKVLTENIKDEELKRILQRTHDF